MRRNVIGHFRDTLMAVCSTPSSPLRVVLPDEAATLLKFLLTVGWEAQVHKEHRAILHMPPIPSWGQNTCFSTTPKTLGGPGKNCSAPSLGNGELDLPGALGHPVLWKGSPQVRCVEYPCPCRWPCQFPGLCRTGPPTATPFHWEGRLSAKLSETQSGTSVVFHVRRRASHPSDTFVLNTSSVEMVKGNCLAGF